MGLLFRLPFLLVELLLRRLLGREDDAADAYAPVPDAPVAPTAPTPPPPPNLRAVAAEPWDGYDGMPAAAVVQRLRGSDAATKGAVRLYEQQHKARATVLRAAG